MAQALSCLVMVAALLPSQPNVVSAASVAGDVDYAVRFGGGSQYATALDNSVFDIRTAISLQAWVRPTSECWAADCMIINKEVAYELAIHNGTYQYAIQGLSGSWFYVNTGVSPRLNQWQHVAITRAAGADVVRFYLDGRLVFTGGASAAANGQINDSPHPFTVGGRSDNAIPYVYASFFPGAIDEVRLWNIERSATEVVSDMHSYGPVNASGLVAYYDFNEGPSASSGSGTLYNRVSGASSATNLALVNSPRYFDVKQTSFAGTNTVVTFPRSYLTAAGGWRAPSGVSTVRALLVGGGGGGGGDNGGGGGGGGVYDSATASVDVSGGAKAITVGQGGTGTNYVNALGDYVFGSPTGQSTTAFGLSAGGGGLGGTADGSVAVIHAGTAGASKVAGTTGAGGSGGGASSESGLSVAGVVGGAAGSGPPNGFSGGAGRQANTGGAGGGGAGAVGASGTTSTTGASGGAGVSSDITGSSTVYGGGGGGGNENAVVSQSAGGSGGGGRGAAGNVGIGENGAANTGGGGGGGTWTGSVVSGGNGGSGVVIVSYTSPRSDEIDYSLSVNGSNQFGIASTKVFDASANFTVEAWVYDDIANQGFQYVVSQGVSNFWLGLFGATQEIYVTDWRTGVNLPVGEWVHLAVTRTGSTLTLFVNGAQAAQNVSFVLPSSTLSANFTVGRFLDTRNEYWDGRIDEVKVWNTVRTEAQIASGMHSYTSPAASNLVAYYDFNEGAGSTVYNRAEGSAAATNLALNSSPSFTDVKTTSYVGSDTVVTFPRSYITEAGGWSAPAGITSLDYLVVAGGGGGGGPGTRSNWNGGGGAGGEVVAGTLSSLSASLPVTVGVGGRGGPKNVLGNATEGGTSALGSVISRGGGRGGSSVASTTVDGSSVYTETTYRPSGTATGGGGGAQTGFQRGATGTLFSGGNGFRSDTATQQGGGGGAGAAASGSAATTGKGGAGGVGALSSITGTSTRYGGGGGGGTANSAGNQGAGGSGGGGAGGSSSTSGSNGTANTGGGGGGVGGATSTGNSGGDGGSGIVIVRYTTVSTSCTGAKYYSENGYAIVAFTTVTAGCTWTVPTGVSSVDYLVVAGGGGGGFRHGGGGGAGGLLTQTNVSVTAGAAATIVVGAGGSGGSTSGTGMTSGGNSQLSGAGISTVTAIGGGAQASTGGSGGGSNTASAPGAAGTAGQGTRGGDGRSGGSCQGIDSGWCGGGGGGAGAAGQNADDGNNNKPGNGGVGLTTNLLSTTAATALGIGEVSGGNVYFAGGGGGGAETNGIRSSGGLGGGAAGMVGPNDTLRHGTANTGGGGGGGGYLNSGGSSGGGNGGSGVVVIRYSLTTSVCAPVTYTDGAYTVAEFKNTGTCTWTVPTGVVSVDVLAVGGGGGGGAWVGAGGGGGGVTDTRSQVTPGASVTVVVGAGGAGSAANTNGTLTEGSNGGASSFAAVTAAGGGRGATWDRFAAGSGASVATGGGGSQATGTYARGTGSASTPNRLGGNANNNFQPHATGGGAGAGGDGESGTSSTSGAGGVGVSSSITGAAIHYGGGGGGSGHGVWANESTLSSTFPSGAGGIGGGGSGRGPAAVTDAVYGGDGADGLGGGGGGAGTYWGVAAYRYSEGGDGGDGIVIVRYPTVPCVPTQSTVGVHVVLTFSSVGECVWTVPNGVTTLDYLVVGGGGGGGVFQNTSNGGGGGAGGVLDGSGLSVTPTQGVSVTVGAGGAGGSIAANGGAPGVSGGDSTVSGTGVTTITAVGGGHGAGSTANYQGGDGGSGGGALGSASLAANGGSGVVGPPRQGYDGGANNDNCGSRRPGGGGGGASAPGGSATCVNNTNHQSGAGGAGRAVSITGSSVVYGGGGGGGGYGFANGGVNPGAGGAGGGGAGGGRTGSPGTDGRGGGGGGAGFDASPSVSVTGGRGGNGVVVLRYLDRILSKVAGDSQTGTGNNQAPVNPKVRVVDAAGNGVDGVTVSFTAGASSGSVGSASVTTSGGGYAETTWTFGTGVNQTVTATMSLSGSTTMTFTASVTTSFAVSYDANGGTGAPVQASQNVGSTVTVSATTPTRIGHTFSSWNTAADGSGTQYAPGATFTMPTNAVTLHAQWTVNSHNVIYDANGGSGAPSSASANFGSTVTLSTTRPTRTGHSFTGWNTAANGSGTSYAWNGSAFSPASFTLGDANVTLFAQWSVNSYTVSYDANGGTGAPSSQSANYNTSVTVSATVPTRTGHSFTGWNTAADGSGISAASSSSFTLGDANVTLFAQWSVNSYTVSYDANGGTGAPSSASANFGSTVTLSTTRPTRTGHSFTGWNTAANGSGTSYAWNGSAFSPASFTLGDANVTLFAQWSVNSYTVSYDANGGTGAPSSQSANYNTSVTVSATVPTRTGHSFAGWNTAANGSGSDYSSGTSLLVTENVTLFAKWTVQTFSISYNANGGSGAPATASGIAFGAATTISVAVPTRSGYTFTGWNSASNGSGVSYPSGSSITMPANNLSLFAQWTATIQTVSYDANGGSGAPSSVSVATDATVTVSSSLPTRAGYTFQRWNTAANGSGVDYSAGATFTMGASNVTLHAVWLANSYSVTYDANGGMSPPASSTAQTDATVTVSSSLPTRAGYTFSSWNTARNASGTHYSSSATFTMPAEAVTLFAIWSANANNLVYNANGGTGAPATSVATTDSTATVSSTVPTRSGYTFAGWNTAVNGSGMTYAAGSTFTMPTAHLTLYAQWTAATFQVLYDANNGTGAPGATSGAYLSAVTLSSTAPTRLGYTFTGWNTSAGGSGTAYASSGSLVMPAVNVTLYAQWVPDNFDLIFNMNGGSGGPTSAEFGTSSTVTLATASAARPTRTGYTFTGWNTAANGSGSTYAWNGSTWSPASFVMPPSDVFLYAQWSVNSYNVVYDVNGAAGAAPASQTAQFMGSVTLAAALTRTGYTFAGWNTAANGSGVQFAAGASYTVGSSDVTLYAEWDRNVNALMFDALGGFSAPAVRFGATGVTVTLPTTVPVREGHTFVHWEDSNQTQLNPGDSFVMPVSSVTLFAQWSINSYQLAYDLNGGVGTVPTAQNVVFASTVTVVAASLTRSGFTFGGWNTAGDGSGTALGAGSSFTMPARPVTLYAQWAEVPPAPTTTTTTVPVVAPPTTLPSTTVPSSTRSSSRSVAAPTSTTPSRQSATPATTTTTTSTTVPTPVGPPTTGTPGLGAADEIAPGGGTFTWLWVFIGALALLLLVWTVTSSRRRRT